MFNATIDPGIWPVVNTGALIVLAIVQFFARRKTSRDLSLVAKHVADTRRIAKESHNDLVGILETRYDDSPDDTHRYRRRETDH